MIIFALSKGFDSREANSSTFKLFNFKKIMTIICLIGPSGSGKTTLAEAIAAAGLPTIHSYTTRPMRPGEQDGREHIFIRESEAHHLLTTRRPMAYTNFGGYRYFALWEQIINRPAITYVIDEAGYHSLLTQSIELQDELKNAYGICIDHIELLPIRIERSEEALAATIDPARLRRDAGREAFDGTIPYRIVIHNDAPDAQALTTWAHDQLTTALITWLCHAPVIRGHNPTHLTTHMGIAEIIAALNGAIACGEVKKLKS